MLMAFLLIAFIGVSHGDRLTLRHDQKKPGLNIAVGSVGLHEKKRKVKHLEITIGGPVQRAWLYWSGRDAGTVKFGERRKSCSLDQQKKNCVIPPQPPPFRDQVLRFDGHRIVGDILDTESELKNGKGLKVNNITYIKDVTAIVQPKGQGNHTFTVEDGDKKPEANLFHLNGASLLVLYTDPTDTNPYRIMIFAGADYVHNRSDEISPAKVTEPVVFDHGASGKGTSRLILFVGDAKREDTERLRITHMGEMNPQVEDIKNELGTPEQPQWDVFDKTSTLPAKATRTKVELFSEGQNPESLIWVLAALRYPLPNPKIDITKQPAEQTVIQDGTADFTLTVRNTGDVHLTDVVVNDPSVPSCHRVIGKLPVGAQDSFTCSLSPVVKSFTNRACATGRFSGTPVEDCDEAKVTVMAVPAISIEKEPKRQRVRCGSKAKFRITVRNTGDVPLNQVRVYDPKAPSCSKVLGRLGVGQSKHYPCHAKTAEPFTNKAKVVGLAPNGHRVMDMDMAEVVVSSQGDHHHDHHGITIIIKGDHHHIHTDTEGSKQSCHQ